MSVYDFDEMNDRSLELENEVDESEFEELDESELDELLDDVIEDTDEEIDDYNDDMDGDHDSNMRSIGWGTDEDYGTSVDWDSIDYE